MADPLELLRQYTKDKKEIIERNNQIIFGEFSWPKDVKTNFLQWRSPKDRPLEGGAKEYYTLESLLFFLKTIDMIHFEYVKQAEAANIEVVRRPARKEVLAYLNGAIDTCPSIDKSAPLVKPTQVKRTHDNDNGEEAAAKKPRNKESHVKKVREERASRLGTHKETSNC